MSTARRAIQAPPDGLVRVRISAVIDYEYATRCPDFLPLDKLNEGWCSLSVDEARAVLADAKFNSDRTAVDVGPHGVPIGAFNAYKALARQIEVALAEVADAKGGV